MTSPSEPEAPVADPERAATGRLEQVAVSPWAREGLDGSPAFVRPPLVADCTLRDGEQQPGLVFAVDRKIDIARKLATIGVSDLELGTPAVSDADVAAIEQIAALGLGAKTSALARALRADVDLVRRCGVDAVRLSMPISPRQRAAKLRLDDGEYVRRALAIASYAKEQELEVVFSPYDTTRCELSLLRTLLAAFARESCVDRVRLVDTTGAASPQAVGFLVRVMLDAGEGIPIEVHCHDDFGLATANTVAGALAGASYLSTTVNGVGERAGNAALEEVVTCLALLYGIDLGIDLTGLTALSELVEDASGVPVQPHKAVVGRNAFAHESGLVVSGLVRDPFTAESYAPELVGQRRRIVVGKKSGRVAVEAKLAELYGDAVPAVDVDRLVQRVKAESLAAGRALHDEELVALVTELEPKGS